MVCENCGSELRKGWKFCPICGGEIIQEDIFISIGNILRNITAEMERRSRDLDRNVEVLEEEVYTEKPYNGAQHRKAETSVKSYNNKTRHSKPANPKLEAIEPKSLVKNLGNRMLAIIQLPDVKENNIKIMELEESFEIKASSKSARYFKIITVPKGFSLASKHFAKGKLTLEFFVQ